MNYPLTGYHHITACAGGAQEDVDFFTQAVGLRIAKQTVLMDGKIPIYHLYYSNANLEPGSVMTTFPYSRRPGRRGSGQVQATTFTVPAGTLSFWQEHFKRRQVEQSRVPGGFEKDEPREKLGKQLHLPPWWADRKQEILAQLEPIQVPETATAAA